MTGITGSLVQALLCLLAIAAFRVVIVQLGPRIGAILMGMPMLMFPMLAIQAWQGPPVTQAQMSGSIAAIVALNGGLWLYRLPVPFGPATGLLAVALSWLMLVAFLFLAKVADWAMASILILNGLFILIRHRDRRTTVVASRGRITDGAVLTTVFLMLFFLVTRLVPDFLRGVLVGFPIGALATIYFVRRILPLEAFRDFIVYTQGAILSAAMFLLFVHFSLVHLPIALGLAASLAVSLATTMVVGRVWRAPRVVQPPPGPMP
jgi:uncharacterized membrane protein (GlpM family)